jgi:hypothetical protein
VGNATLETRSFRELLVEMNGVLVTRDARKQDHVRFGNRACIGSAHPGVKIFDEKPVQFARFTNSGGDLVHLYRPKVLLHRNKLG